MVATSFARCALIFFRADISLVIDCPVVFVHHQIGQRINITTGLGIYSGVDVQCFINISLQYIGVSCAK